MRKQTRKDLPASRPLNGKPAAPDGPQAMRDIRRLLDGPNLPTGSHDDLANARDDRENSEILLAACRIVIRGYQAQMLQGEDDSLFIQAAYQLLHRFLEREFAAHSSAA